GGNENLAPINCENPVGIDWYWQHWVNGVLEDEEYLYTTCPCGTTGGGGGGGGTGNSGAAVDGNQTWVGKEQTGYPENWKITGVAHLGGVTFPNPNYNFFTACDFLNAARMCGGGGGSVTCDIPSHILYSVFTEINHSAGIMNSSQAFSSV